MKNSTAINKIDFALALLLAGCGPMDGNKNLEKEAYVQEIKTGRSNVFEKTVGDKTYKLIYKPAEYMLLTENKDVPASEYAALIKDYQSLEYYTLEIMIKDFNDEILKYKNGSEGEYADKVEYYSFGFQRDIYEVIGKDTVSCGSYHFERNYGISPKVRFNLAFSASASKDDRLICINEKYLGSGTIKFSLTQKDFDNCPTLKN